MDQRDTCAVGFTLKCDLQLLAAIGIAAGIPAASKQGGWLPAQDSPPFGLASIGIDLVDPSTNLLIDGAGLRCIPKYRMGVEWPPTTDLRREQPKCRSDRQFHHKRLRHR